MTTRPKFTRTGNTRTMSTGNGTPTSWGVPGKSAARTFHGTGQIGAQGEYKVAGILATLPAPPGTFVFHDVTPSGGDGNLDHVVVRGDTLTVIDAKNWAAGTYVTEHETVSRDIWNHTRNRWETETGQKTTVTRNGRPFEPGSAASLPWITSALLRDLGWKGRTIQVISVSCTSGDDTDLNFDNYRIDQANIIRTSDLQQTLLNTLRRARTGPVTDTVNRLIRLCNRHTVASPFPARLENFPIPAPTGWDTESRTGPVAKAAVLAGVAGAASIGAAALSLPAANLAITPAVAAGAVYWWSSTSRPVGPSMSPGQAAREFLNKFGNTDPPPTRTLRRSAQWTGAATGTTIGTGFLANSEAATFPLAGQVISDLAPLVQVAASLIVIVAAFAGWAAWTNNRTRTVLPFHTAASQLPAWAIPLFAVTIAETDGAMDWFNQLEVSRSQVWGAFATAATQTANPPH